MSTSEDHTNGTITANIRNNNTDNSFSVSRNILAGKKYTSNSANSL